MELTAQSIERIAADVSAAIVEQSSDMADAYKETLIAKAADEKKLEFAFRIGVKVRPLNGANIAAVKLSWSVPRTIECEARDVGGNVGASA